MVVTLLYVDTHAQSKMTSVSLTDQDRVSKQASQTSPDLVQFANDVLRRHNVHRKQHGSVIRFTFDLLILLLISYMYM